MRGHQGSLGGQEAGGLSLGREKTMRPARQTRALEMLRAGLCAEMRESPRAGARKEAPGAGERSGEERMAPTSCGRGSGPADIGTSPVALTEM